MVNEFRASVWSASRLLALFPAFVGHCLIIGHFDPSPDVGLWTSNGRFLSQTAATPEGGGGWVISSSSRSLGSGLESSRLSSAATDLAEASRCFFQIQDLAGKAGEAVAATKARGRLKPLIDANKR
jgi:hypothetical protein